MSRNSLLNELVRRTELSSMIAKGCVLRACEKAGVDPQHLLLADLPQVLPEIERGVRTFHDAAEANRIVAELRKFARG